MQSNAKPWIIAAVLVVAGFVGYGIYVRSPAPATGAGGAGAPHSAAETPAGAPASAAAPSTPSAPSGVAISIASSNTKEAWLASAVKAFNQASERDPSLQLRGQPIRVDVLKETVDGKSVDYRSGTMVADTLAERIRPTILSPGEESWLTRLANDWRTKHGTALVKGASPVLARTPLVIALWQSRAKALGCLPSPGPTCTWERLRSLAADRKGWAAVGHPEWTRFTLGYGYFGESNSGTLAVLSMCMAGARKAAGLEISDVGPDTACGKFVAGVDQAKSHSGKSDLWLLEKMVEHGPEYLDAVVTYESNVIQINAKHGATLREPLVAAYPQDGTVVVGHPFAVLDGAPWVSPEQAEAAAVFREFLLGKAQQEALLATGLRPASPDVKLVAPIDAASGVNPEATLKLLQVPEARVLEQLGEVWARVKKHALLVVLFDKSGSMTEGGKIGAAVRGAQEFVKQMGGEDQLIWMPFDNQVFDGGVRGRKADVGEELVSQIASTRASGGTALYDGLAAAFRLLTAERQKRGDTVRYGVVLLSDGKDTNSTGTLAQLEELLKPQESDPTGVQIHAIAIGGDADELTLRRIVNAAHGRFWKGNDQKDMVRIYKEIATYW